MNIKQPERNKIKISHKNKFIEFNKINIIKNKKSKPTKNEVKQLV